MLVTFRANIDSDNGPLKVVIVCAVLVKWDENAYLDVISGIMLIILKDWM